MKKHGLTALALCAVMLLSGCAESKAPAASETAAVTAASTSEAETSGAPETSGTTAETTTAKADKSTAAETTTAGTEESTAAETTTTAAETTTALQTSAPETTVSETLGGKVVSAETTTVETVTEPETSGPAVHEPPPEIDEDMFTLYIGGSEKAEKYDVEVKALSEDVTGGIIKALKAGARIALIKDKNGNYSISDLGNAKTDISTLKSLENSFTRESYEEMKEFLKDTEYADMSYEEFVEEMLDTFEKIYPGIRDMFDENMKLKDGRAFDNLLVITAEMRDDFRTAYCDEETVIREGLKGIFDILENNSEYEKFVKGIDSGDTPYREAIISYNGGYCVAAGVSVKTLSSGEWRHADLVWLGKAKVYENDPKLLTRQIFAPDYPLFEDINTEDSPFEMSLEIVSEGYRGDGVEVSESGYSNILRGDMTLGRVPEIEFTEPGEEYGFSFGEVKQLRIKFRIKEGYRDNVLGKYTAESPELEGIGRLYVFAFDDSINISLPLETWHDEKENIVYTVTDGRGGTFSLVDFEIWIDQFAALAGE